MFSIIESVVASKGFYQELLNQVCRKYDLTDSEILILDYLAHHHKRVTATDIVGKQGLKKAIVSVSLKDLEKRGLVDATHSEDDHRSIYLELTDTSKGIIRETKKIEHEYLQIILEDFDDEEKEQFKKYVRRITDNIDNYKEK